MAKMEWKDVEKTILEEHNHSWIADIYQRNKNNLDKVAITFRENEISYRDYFKYVIEYAKALKAYGVKKGDSFVACLRQTPDYPILFGAASLIGATVKFPNAGFDQDYLASIIKGTTSNIVFVTDWDLESMKDALHKGANDKKIVSLSTSKWDIYDNPHKEVTERFFKFDEEGYSQAINEFENTISRDEFLEKAKTQDDIFEEVGLDDTLVVCYTSGSSKPGIHKGVPIKNKTYVLMGRYHDPEVCGMPKMDKLVTLSAIGTQADTTLLSGVSDTLMQGGTIALDPISDKHYFPYSLLFNKAQLAIATKSYWVQAAKDTYTNEDLKGLELKDLYVPSEGGEPLTAGEESFLNRWLKHIKAGINKTHTAVSVIKMSVGGGDTENGNIFLQLFRAYKNAIQKVRGIHEPIGLKPYNFAEVKILRPDGTYCEPYEVGRMVAKSPMTMSGYDDPNESTKDFFITDAYGNTWGSLGNLGYLDKSGNAYYKGRIKEEKLSLKPFEVSDVVLRDAKNIMSCETVIVDGYYVCHVEMQPDKKVNLKKTLLSAENRCISILGEKIKDKLLFRVRSFEEGYPVNYITKRNTNALVEEGITEKCILPSDYYSTKKEKTKRKLING